MNSFTAALSSVIVMLIYAVPGFLLIKTKLVSKDSISSFARLLMFVCSPALVIYSVSRVEYSPKMALELLIVLVFLLVFQGGMLFIAYLILKKKMTDAKYRIFALATCLANCAFMGVPVLEALLPDYPEAVAFSAMASLALNILGWTVASFIITGDRRHMSAKKILLNPTTLALAAVLPVFFFSIDIPPMFDGIISLLGRMSTPMCMIIMGMRLATSTFKNVFGSFSQYVVIAIKQLVFPLICLLLLALIPIDGSIKKTVYIMMCCPVASVVLNFAEMLGEGQKEAANLVLLGTLLSTATIPLMVLFI
ncbi:MAG: hypothetical protein E7660_03280 [Ruminococcaceae bacterium]|nr:hypothetical protein [Oscillospiraceae bacterium]